MSYPEQRNQVLQGFLEVIEENKLEFTNVSGTATAGISHAALIADRLNMPMSYVRGKAKGHGKKNQIEGHVTEEDTALVVEDLISTGGSSIDAGLALRETGATVNDCVAIFSYQMESAITGFQEANLNVHTLSDFSTLMQVAVTEGYITSEEQSIALKWNQDPAGWGKAMGYE